MKVVDRWQQILGVGDTSDDDRLVAYKVERERHAVCKPLPKDLHPQLAEALLSAGISELYSHQAASYESVANDNTIITTGTASGKSLCFNLPTLNAIYKDGAARALYIYPTKALAQDQARKLTQLSGADLNLSIYDGDTPSNQRAWIKKKANIVLTNPDMLNVGILPHHSAWGDFFSNLDYVVLDEAHVYRGVFGSHVANVLRRLRRVAGLYGSGPRFILTSATIANPVQLAEKLTGLNFESIGKDGSPMKRKLVAIWNPPLTDPKSGTRKSVLSEAAEVFAKLVGSGVRTICFTRSRRATELIYKFSQLRLEEGSDTTSDSIAPYRAGYTPQQRRKLEGKLADGELRGVVATSALELGIDIGHLDAAICATYPGTVASLRQRWGRAGRSREGIALFIAGEDALDQYFCRNPEQLLDRPVEAAILDHENENIYLEHLVAAAYEAPLETGDRDVLGTGLERSADKLVERGRLRKHRGRYLLREKGFPAKRISLRSSSTDSFDVIQNETGELLGTVEAERAFRVVAASSPVRWPRASSYRARIMLMSPGLLLL